MKGDRTVVIGGGFFGMYIAEYLARSGSKVILLERESELMTRASMVNQARVHNGYHYPRSVLTALRSRVSFPKFVREFKDCIDDSFQKYYMIGRLLGKVTARQFKKFCHRIGASIDRAPDRIIRLANPALVEDVFLTTEYAFNAPELRRIMKTRLDSAGVAIQFGSAASRVQRQGEELVIEVLNGTAHFIADQVYNCTYSMLNSILTNSGLSIIPLKHEMAEVCLVDVPEVLKNVGITIVCGPFFSVMPFPSENLHSFSHVRYTPHFEWKDGDDNPYVNPNEYFHSLQQKSNWRAMQLDAARYVPMLSECVYRKSMWEVKTTLPLSEGDDSRPILFKPNYMLPGFHCVIGGKMDNVYDAIELLKRLRSAGG